MPPDEFTLTFPSSRYFTFNHVLIYGALVGCNCSDFLAGTGNYWCAGACRLLAIKFFDV